MELTSESVLALAPDASSVKAAQALLKPGQWPTLGFNENAQPHRVHPLWDVHTRLSDESRVLPLRLRRR